ncbi:MAG: hypothetical protein ACD_23C00679G0001, partial [uncultured bacterium]
MGSGMACSIRLACSADPSGKISSLKSYRLLCSALPLAPVPC